MVIVFILTFLDFNHSERTKTYFQQTLLQHFSPSHEETFKQQVYKCNLVEGSLEDYRHHMREAGGQDYSYFRKHVFQPAGCRFTARDLFSRKSYLYSGLATQIKILFLTVAASIALCPS